MINDQLKKRLKSLLWRAAMMALAGFLDVVVQELGGLNMPDALTLLLGLGFGEVSKYLNNKYRKD